MPGFMEPKAQPPTPAPQETRLLAHARVWVDQPTGDDFLVLNILSFTLLKLYSEESRIVEMIKRIMTKSTRSLLIDDDLSCWLGVTPDLLRGRGDPQMFQVKEATADGAEANLG
jgi:hypothetical protein